MARVWIEDRKDQKDYKNAVKKAKEAKRQPPGRWRVRWYDHAQRPKSLTFQKKKAAESKVTDLETSLADGTYRDPAAGQIKIRKVVEDWFKVQKNLKKSTKNRYWDLLTCHILPRWGDYGAIAVEYDEYALWLAEIQKEENDAKPVGNDDDREEETEEKEDDDGLGASQTRSVHSVMCGLMDWCVKSKKIAFNPVRGVPLPKLPPPSHVYLDYGQVEKLAEEAGKLTTKHKHPTAYAPINRQLILVLAYMGLRFGEAAAVKVGAVDLKRRRMHITATLHDEGTLWEDTPKSGESRIVAIPKFLVPILRPLLKGRQDHEYLFTTRRGAPLRLRNWRRLEFNRARNAAGLDATKLTPHKLRHTAASLAVAAGADVYVVQRMLGHKKASITLDIYGNLWPDRLDEVADAISARRAKAHAKRAKLAKAA